MGRVSGKVLKEGREGGNNVIHYNIKNAKTQMIKKNPDINSSTFKKNEAISPNLLHPVLDLGSSWSSARKLCNPTVAALFSISSRFKGLFSPSRITVVSIITMSPRRESSSGGSKQNRLSQRLPHCLALHFGQVFLCRENKKPPARAKAHSRRYPGDPSPVHLDWLPLVL